MNRPALSDIMRDSVGKSRQTPEKESDTLVFIGGRFPPAVRQQLKIISAEQNKPIQQCLDEALNLLFAAHNKAEVAPAGKDR